MKIHGLESTVKKVAVHFFVVSIFFILSGCSDGGKPVTEEKPTQAPTAVKPSEVVPQPTKVEQVIPEKAAAPKVVAQPKGAPVVKADEIKKPEAEAKAPVPTTNVALESKPKAQASAGKTAAPEDEMDSLMSEMKGKVKSRYGD